MAAVSIEQDLRTLLLTFSAVTAYTGTGASARIRPDKLHQSDDETAAHVIIEVDSENPLNTLDGLGGRVYARVTLRSRSRVKSTARALAEAIRTNGTDPGTGLAGYNGTVNSHTLDAVLDGMQTSFTQDDDGSDNGYYDVFSTYICTWAEDT